MLGLRCCGCVPCSCSKQAYSLVAVRELFIVVASLVADPRLQGTWSSVVAAHGLSCPAACGIFRDQESNSRSLHQQVDSYPLDHQGSPLLSVLKLFINLLLHEVDTVIISILQIKKLSHREMRKVA